MILQIYKYDSDEPLIIDEVRSFEFRTNKVSEWLRVVYEDGSSGLIKNVCTIKAS